MSRRIRFDEIPPRGLRLELSFTEALPGLEQRLLEPLTAELRLTRQGAHKVLVEGRLTARLELCCDRCLTPYGQAVDDAMVLLLEYRGHDMARDTSGNHEVAEAPETVLLESPLVDVPDILRQQVCLILPLKRLCREDCPGLCPICGALRGGDACRCAAQEGGTTHAWLVETKR